MATRKRASGGGAGAGAGAVRGAGTTDGNSGSAVDAVTAAAGGGDLRTLCAHIARVADTVRVADTTISGYGQFAGLEYSIVGLACVTGGPFVLDSAQLSERLAFVQGKPTLAATSDGVRLTGSAGGAGYRMRRVADPDGALGVVPRMTGDAVESARVNVGTLLARMRAAQPCVGVSTGRPHLDCMLVGLWAGAGDDGGPGDTTEVCCVATDGHRLAVCGPEVWPADGVTRLLLPSASLRAVTGFVCGHGVAMLRSSSTLLEVTVGGDGGANGDGGDARLVVRLAQASFPPWGQLLTGGAMRDNAGDQFEVSASVLADALRSVGLSSGLSHGVRVAVQANALHLSSSSPDDGESEDTVSATVQAGAVGRQAGVNYVYLRECLAGALALAGTGGSDDASVSVRIGGDLDPIDIRAPQYRAVVMPMRI